MSELVPTGSFVDVGHWQVKKYDQGAAGDSFLSQKQEADGRIITVLSDGLGSGIKAGVLSTLTATMALKFVAANIPIKRAARIIMDTLPVCKERGLSYATFTLVDIEPSSQVRVMEYDNPEYLLIRDNAVVGQAKQCTAIERKNKKAAPAREAVLQYSEYAARAGDRLVFFSDGVTQSGMGTKAYPFGWGLGGVRDFILGLVAGKPEISARELAREVVLHAQIHDAYLPKDDITCGVIYFRHPRDLLVLTGPPVNPERDDEMARDFSAFKGRKILCGGTTANIVSRVLGRKIDISLKNLDPVVPPMSKMEGADLVTEGIITLGKVADLLERGAVPGANASPGGIPGAGERENGATKIVELLLDSDRILFYIGTKINEAHQDPNMPVELDIRRNIIKKIQQSLVNLYLKEVTLRYI